MEVKLGAEIKKYIRKDGFQSRTVENQLRRDKGHVGCLSR
jgi:hypothetical protein